MCMWEYASTPPPVGSLRLTRPNSGVQQSARVGVRRDPNARSRDPLTSDARPSKWLDLGFRAPTRNLTYLIRYT
jgi:hypothetical protein